MTAIERQRDELRDLLAAMESGEITPGGVDRIDVLTQNSDELLEIYVEYIQLVSDLRFGLTDDRIQEVLGHVFSGDELLAGPTEDSPWTPSAAFQIDADANRHESVPFYILPSSLGGPLSHFSQGMPFAYLVATLIFGLGLLIGSLVHVSRHESITSVSPPSPPTAPHEVTQAVARITGMVDCVWEGTGDRAQRGGAANQKSQIRNHKSLLHLGDRLALNSGLLEITYDTGAKVILQGPVTYEVESATGGYLSIGKLTARLEQKSEVRGQRSGAANQNSESRDPLTADLCPLTSGLFAIRTPTALVTDLGTEFGVEVNQDGVTETHVFEGRVLAARVGRNAHAATSQPLSAGQGMRIEADGMTMISRQGHGQTLIRSLPRRRPPVTFLEPTPYQSFDNRQSTPNISPFSKAAGGPFGPLSGDKGQRHWVGPLGQYFYLEDLESGAVRATGLSIEGGRVVGVNDDPKATDPVDEDDGVIDNATDGTVSHSLYDASSVTFVFDKAVLGQLPTHVGIVVTDSDRAFNTTLEAFGAAGELLGKKKLYNSTFARDTHACGAGAAEKSRFCGVVSASPGIARLVVTAVAVNNRVAKSGIEVDHIQYGFSLRETRTTTADDDPDQKHPATEADDNGQR